MPVHVRRKDPTKTLETIGRKHKGRSFKNSERVHLRGYLKLESERKMSPIAPHGRKDQFPIDSTG